MNQLHRNVLTVLQNLNQIRTTSVTLVEPKKQKLTIWPEWNENDVNNEKWDVGGKARDSKSKPTSAPVSR